MRPEYNCENYSKKVMIDIDKSIYIHKVDHKNGVWINYRYNDNELYYEVPSGFGFSIMEVRDKYIQLVGEMEVIGVDLV